MSDMSERERLVIARQIAHEREHTIEGLQAEKVRLQRLIDNRDGRIDALRERLGQQSTFIMRLMAIVAKFAPETLVNDLVSEAAHSANGAAKVHGLSLHITPHVGGREL